jgi:hypothetical protein
MPMCCAFTSYQLKQIKEIGYGKNESPTFFDTMRTAKKKTQFYSCVSMRCHGNVFTESLPSIDREIFTEQLPSKEKWICK